MIESHHSRFVCFLYGANDPLIRGEPSCGKLALGQNIRSLGAPLKNFNDGGGGGGLTEVHILYPKKSQLQNLSTQKNHYFF